MTAVHIAGAGMVRFGKYDPAVTFEKLAVEAARNALRDAGAHRRDIEAVFVGHVFGGPVAGQRVATELGLWGRAGGEPQKLCGRGAALAAGR